MKNQLCVCGSGKKQKDCCKDCHEVEISIVDEQKNVIEIKSYLINEEPIPLGIDTTDEEIMRNALEIAKKDSQRAVKVYKKLIGKYPGHHRILHNLACMYMTLDKDKEAQEILEKNVKNYPAYIFSRVMLGLLYLKHNQTDKIPELLVNSYDISFVWPDRKVFHLTEALAFNLLVGSYFCDINQLDQANLYLRMIKNLSPEAEQAKKLEYRIKMRKETDDLLKIIEKIELRRLQKKKTKNEKRIKNVE